MSEVKIAETPHEFRMGNGEFDEVFVSGASVHIERMDVTAFWIGIDCPGKPSLMVNTGICDGVWFFNVEEDTLEEGQFFTVRRPRRAAPTELENLLKRVSAAESALAEAKAESIKWAGIAGTYAGDIELLKAENERLRAPVSDEEWIGICSGDLVEMADIQRHELEAFLAARSQQPTESK